MRNIGIVSSSTAGVIVSLATATPAAAPTVTTSSASVIRETTATLNGSVSTGTLSYDYGTSVSYGSTSANGSLTGLSGNTTYYFRAKSTISSTSISASGTVTPSGQSTTVVFEYSTDQSNWTAVTATQSPLTGSTAQSVSATLTSLSPGTTYYVRIKATVGATSVYSASDTSATTAAAVTNGSGLSFSTVDCRQHDAGGSGWSTSAETLYTGTCGNRQSYTRTTYTKEYCTTYTRDTNFQSSPDCNAGCFSTSTSTVYSGSCAGRTQATRTTYTANPGTNCTTYYSDGPYTSSPDCGSVGGACWTNVTSSYYGNYGFTFAGKSLTYYNIGYGEWIIESSGNEACADCTVYNYILYTCGGSQGYIQECGGGYLGCYG